MEYIDFIVEHYIWFLVGGIVLLMVIIGYIAEKTEFGRKKPAKKEKKEVAVQAVETPNIEPEVVAPDSEEVEEPMENLDPIDLKEVVDPEVLAEVEEPTEDVLETVEPEEIVVEEQPEIEESSEEIPEELYAGLDGTPNQFKEENTTNIELPNIEALKDDTESFDDEEDMWKF